MLDEIGDARTIPAFIESVKAGKGRLMGFGHRVYKSYDPRAKLIKKVADDVFEQTGPQPEARDRARARADRARGRLLRLAQALPERRLLLRPDLPGDGLPDRLLHRALRARPAPRLDRAVGGDARRPRAEDRAPAPGLHRLRTSATSCRSSAAAEPRRDAPAALAAFPRFAARRAPARYPACRLRSTSTAGRSSSSGRRPKRAGSRAGTAGRRRCTHPRRAS